MKMLLFQQVQKIEKIFKINELINWGKQMDFILDYHSSFKSIIYQLTIKFQVESQSLSDHFGAIYYAYQPLGYG